jgi:hypothetical protein
MKKVYLSVLGFALICRMSTHAQTRQVAYSHTPINYFKPAFKLQEDTGYNARALRLDEVDIVSSYYNQNGNHSAITGGIGTEQVNDFSNGLDLHFGWQGNNQNKNTLNFGLGYDHHTSASSAYVTTTGLGKKDGTRIYPSLDWTVENAKTGNTFGLGSYYSGEYNYKSFGADMHFSLKTHDKNGEFSAKAQAYWDHVTLIYPSEFIQSVNPAPTGQTYITTASGNTVLSSGGGKSKDIALPTSPRNTYTASFSYSQIINSRLTVMVLGDLVKQTGYLSLPFHRVYFTNKKDTIEKLPSSRFKLPLGIRLNYFAGDNLIIRSYYRYFKDDWGIDAHTANLELVYKISPFFSISPFYRYYTQSAAKYFAPYAEHATTDAYYTSNYEYAKFQSSFYGAGLRIAPPAGVLGIQHLHELELRYGHYTQTTGLSSDVVSVSLGFK